jgi:hypothetical protein
VIGARSRTLNSFSPEKHEPAAKALLPIRETFRAFWRFNSSSSTLMVGCTEKYIAEKIKETKKN